MQTFKQGLKCRVCFEDVHVYINRPDGRERFESLFPSSFCLRLGHSREGFKQEASRQDGAHCQQSSKTKRIAIFHCVPWAHLRILAAPSAERAFKRTSIPAKKASRVSASTRYGSFVALRIIIVNFPFSESQA